MKDATEIINLLLEHKTNVEARGVRDTTSLHFVAAVGRRRVAEQLLSCNANIESRSEGYMTSLHYAAVVGQVEAVRLLHD